MYFSPSTKAFYDENIHGARVLVIVDPSWERPTIRIPDPKHNGHGDVPLITVPDESAAPRMIETVNPVCKIPADAVEISDDQYAALLQAQQEGKAIDADDDGHPVAITPEIDLSAMKISYAKAIDIMAEDVRLKFITPGAGQAMVYQRKVQEAETLALDNNPYPPHYPLLAAEVGITGETIQEVAETVLAMRDQWLLVAAAIETARLLAKAAVKQASTAAEIEGVVNSILWPELSQ